MLHHDPQKPDMSGPALRLPLHYHFLVSNFFPEPRDTIFLSAALLYGPWAAPTVLASDGLVYFPLVFCMSCFLVVRAL